MCRKLSFTVKLSGISYYISIFLQLVPLSAYMANTNKYLPQTPFHCSITESFCEIMEVILFTMTLMSSIVIAFNLFTMESIGLSLEAVVAFWNLSLSIILLFVYCYLSDWITFDLVEVGDIFYNSPWYQLGSREQCLIILPIQRANRLVSLKGLGLFNCSVEVFVSVINFITQIH